MLNFTTADLHLHSSASDGRYTPAALVQRAASAGISIIALTDHDTVAGLEEAGVEAVELGLTLVPGIEISAGMDGEEIHILAYYFDKTNEALATLLKNIREMRAERAGRILDRLEARGVKVSLNFPEAGDGVITRPHVAQAIVEGGYAADRSEAFHRYLAEGRPAFVPKDTVPAPEVVSIIREAGGVSAIAHPGHIRNQSIVNKLIEIGIGGLEYIHPAHDRETSRYYYEFAKVHRLVPVGGSDFHGHRRQDDTLLGRYTVPAARVKQLRRRAAQSITETQDYA